MRDCEGECGNPECEAAHLRKALDAERAKVAKLREALEALALMRDALALMLRKHGPWARLDPETGRVTAAPLGDDEKTVRAALDAARKVVG